MIKLKLIEGTSDEPDPNNPGSFYKLNFQNYFMTLNLDQLEKKEKIVCDAGDLETAQKYFDDAKMTGEGFVYFNQGMYIYRKKYGYAIVPNHKKILARLSNISELEAFIKEQSKNPNPTKPKSGATGVTPASSPFTRTDAPSTSPASTTSVPGRRSSVKRKV